MGRLRYLRFGHRDGIVYLDTAPSGSVRAVGYWSKLGWMERSMLRRAILRHGGPEEPNEARSGTSTADYVDRVLGGVSRGEDYLHHPTLSPTKNADARASGQQVPKKPDRVRAGRSQRTGSAALFVEVEGGWTEALFSDDQVRRIAALINADYNFPWED